jgi:adenylate cyclase
MQDDGHVRHALAEEERRGLELGVRVRLAVLAVVGVWITIENGFPAVLFYYAFLAAFALLAVAPLGLRRLGLEGRWPRYGLAFLETAVLALTLLLANPLDAQRLPGVMRLRLGNEIYLFVYLAAAMFTYSPALVLWTGVSAAVTWSAGVLWLLAGAASAVPAGQDAGAFLLDPAHIFHEATRQVLLIIVVSASLATAVWRSRRLVFRQAQAERERANLSRYFSPNMVAELARSQEPVGATRGHTVAVLFADMVGFTRLAAEQPPEAVIHLLREYHARMAQAVFEHGGTLDEYLGDGIMATFGTPRPSGRDATNAVRAACEMVRLVAAWNAERADAGAPPVRIGVGVHYGAQAGVVVDEERGRASRHPGG